MQLFKYNNKDVVTCRFRIKLISNDKNLKTNFLCMLIMIFRINCYKIHTFLNCKSCLNKEENKYLCFEF